ncbi:MAG TPA: hypothetical protein VJV05_09770 [Pyrinomonadaceae bacterium]|nr:hypothetical protein [Pyrinomonadaceae bacterium]
MTLVRTALAALLISTAATWIAAQTAEFVSYTGGFKVGIAERPNGTSGVGSGIRFSWTLGKIKYELGFHERQGLPLALVGDDFSYEEAVKRYFNQFSTRGERISSSNVTLDGHDGRDFKYKYKTSVFVLRLFLIDDRVYQLLAEYPSGDESSSNKASKIFESVRFIDKDSVEKHYAKQIEDATPKPLPQLPKSVKATTDLQDRNLRGKVKTILTEQAFYALNDSLKQRKKQQLEEFDETGSLVRQIEYDSFGSPSSVRVFGYLAGKRVARIGTVPTDHEIGGIALEFPPGLKADNRFDESTAYKFGNGKIIEERRSFSNGMLFERKTHRFTGSTRETQYFDGGTKPFARMLAELDEKGNEATIKYFERGGTSFVEQDPRALRYDSFDSEGNWTQRLITRWYGLDAKGKMFPENIEYRTITYYPK